MSFIDMSITRRQFAARFVNLGRAMLGDLAAMYGIDPDIAAQWADEIEREQDAQIAGGASPYRPAGIAGGGAEPGLSPGANFIAMARIAASQQGD